MNASCAAPITIAGLLALSACGAPEPPSETGGVELPAPDDDCGRGVAVVQTDYASTNVALVDASGTTLSPNFISSASEKARLSAPLSGDVVLPTAPAAEHELVLLDRYPTSVLTFVDFATGHVRAQLDVGPGFAANPHDYLAVAPDRAYVTRFDSNPEPAQKPFDTGDDLLVVDPSVPRIVDAIPLSHLVESAGQDAETYRARPGTMMRIGDFLYVTLGGYSVSFESALDARLVKIDLTSESIADVLVFDGLVNCAGLSKSPSESALALSCTGLVASENEAAPPGSAVVVVDVESFSERVRFEAGTVDASEPGASEMDASQAGPFGFSIAFTSETSVWVNTLGSLDSASKARSDSLVWLDLDTKQSEILLQAAPFELGSIRCWPECGHCFVADADGSVVHRFDLDGSGRPARRRELTVERKIGLPPRGLGAL